MPGSSQPHGLQHARLPSPSPSPGVCSYSCPLSWWCHPTISISITTFSSCSQSCPASESFPMSQLFTSSGQSIGASASGSVLAMNIQDWFSKENPKGMTGLISLQFKGLSTVFSSTTVQKISSSVLSLLYGPPLISWLLEKIIALTRCTFVGKVMSLLFNTLSRLVTAFLPRRSVVISWLQSPSAVILEPLLPYSPIYLPWSDGTRCHGLHFLNVEF